MYLALFLAWTIMADSVFTIIIMSVGPPYNFPFFFLPQILLTPLNNLKEDSKALLFLG